MESKILGMRARQAFCDVRGSKIKSHVNKQLRNCFEIIANQSIKQAMQSRPSHACSVQEQSIMNFLNQNIRLFMAISEMRCETE